MNNNGPLLEIKNLSVFFDTDSGRICAVDGISLSLPRRKILGLVGETGCGKSVTARTLLRVLPKASWVHISGQILFQGRDLLRLSEKDMRNIRGSDISMIFQEPAAALNPTIKVGRQISEVIAAHLGGSRKEVWNRAVDMLGQVGIPSPREKAHLYPHQFSGGMKQRAMIAGAIACRPDLLIADEPTTAVDVTIQLQILRLISALRDDYGMSVLLISHDLGIIAETCEDVAVMYSGRIVEKSPADEFFTRPLHPYSRGLLAAIPKARETREWLPTIPGRILGQDRVSGCNFADRCPTAQPSCFQEFPTWQRSGDHEVLCSRIRI